MSIPGSSLSEQKEVRRMTLRSLGFQERDKDKAHVRGCIPVFQCHVMSKYVLDGCWIITVAEGRCSVPKCTDRKRLMEEEESMLEMKEELRESIAGSRMFIVHLPSLTPGSCV